MSTKGLVWLDGKGNPIPLSHTLGTHVEAIDPNDLWNSIQTRNNVHTLSQSIKVTPLIPVPFTQTHPHDHPHHPHSRTPCWYEPIRRLQYRDSKRTIGISKDPTWHDAICIECCYLSFYSQQDSTVC